MQRVRVESFSVSVDGFGAGVDQSLENPLGVGGKALHGWAFTTRTFRQMFGQEGGDTGVVERFAARGFENVGAWALGRNMFGPVRGPWPDESWKGGATPRRTAAQCSSSPTTRAGRWRWTAGRCSTSSRTGSSRHCARRGEDVRVGGGVDTIRQGLRAGLIDEMHLACSPVLLGRGERLFDGVDLVAQGYECVEQVGTPHATHVVIRKKG